LVELRVWRITMDGQWSVILFWVWHSPVRCWPYYLPTLFPITMLLFICTDETCRQAPALWLRQHGNSMVLHTDCLEVSFSR